MICSSKHCKSGRAGYWEPVILLWAAGAKPDTHQPASMSIRDFLVCDECKATATPLHFIDRKGWDSVVHAFHENGKLPPDIRTAKIVYVVPDSLKLGGDPV